MEQSPSWKITVTFKCYLKYDLVSIAHTISPFLQMYKTRNFINEKWSKVVLVLRDQIKKTYGKLKVNPGTRWR